MNSTIEKLDEYLLRANEAATLACDEAERADYAAAEAQGEADTAHSQAEEVLGAEQHVQDACSDAKLALEAGDMVEVEAAMKRAELALAKVLAITGGEGNSTI
jgi:transcription elongation GreA/GreB family factor